MKLNPSITGFIKKELTQVFRDPKLWSLLVLAPVLQLTLFGYAISTDVKNISLATLGAPGDFLLNEVTRRALGSGYFTAVETQGPEDAFELIEKNQADAVLIAPPGGLSRASGRGEARVQVLLDATNVTKTQAMEAYLAQILGPPSSSSLSLRTRILYNPSIRSAVFMVPGVLGMLTCILPILLTAMSITKEKEDGTFEMLISAPLTPREIIIGKTIPFVLLGLVHLPFTLSLAHFVFAVPLRGSLWILLLSFVIFIFTTVSSGVLISTITRTQQQSMMGGFLFMFPALMLSGMIFPIENMPLFLRWIAYLNPLTYFLRLLRNIMLKGGEPGLVIQSLLILTGIGALTVFITFKRFKSSLNG